MLGNEAESGRSLRTTLTSFYLSSGRNSKTETEIRTDEDLGSSLDGAEFRVRHNNQLMDFQKILSTGTDVCINSGQKNPH